MSVYIVIKFILVDRKWIKETSIKGQRQSLFQQYGKYRETQHLPQATYNPVSQKQLCSCLLQMRCTSIVVSKKLGSDSDSPDNLEHTKSPDNALSHTGTPKQPKMLVLWATAKGKSHFPFAEHSCACSKDQHRLALPSNFVYPHIPLYFLCRCHKYC